MSILGQKPANSFKKLPSLDQWVQFLKILNKKEKYIFLASFLIFILSAGFLLTSLYHKNTNVVPSDSGSFKYGMVGQPQTINPLYAYSSDIDRALVELTFSSLMDYDQNGNLTPNLIKDYHFTDGGRTIEFSLKENAKWSDGKPLTVDDVVFTIHLVQDSDFMSPLRANWQGVEIEKTSDYKGLIKFKQAYSGALELLANLKIMPKHIWQNATFQGMAGNSELNLFAPVGSGPYKVTKVDQRSDKTVKSITLTANHDYYDQSAHIQKIQIVFFENQNELYNSLKKGAIDIASIENSPGYDLSKDTSLNQYLIQTPDYFSLFFNNNNDPFKDKNIRTAISEAINKDEIINAALLGRAQTIDSPLLPEFYNTFSEVSNPINFDLENAAQTLDKAGYVLTNGVRQKTLQKTTGFKFTKVMQSGSSGADVKKLQECLAQDPAIYPSQNISGNFGEDTKKAVIAFQEKYKDDILTPNGLTAGTGKVSAATIKKLNEVCFVTPIQTNTLSFTIKTSDSPALLIVANAIKNQLQKLGIKIQVQTIDSIEMKRILRERDFDLLLFGEKLGMIPDPLPYWHSSQVIDPGFNFALYQNTSLDALLEKQRTYSDPNSADRLKTLESIQATLVTDAPAVYLYSPKNILMANKKIKGITLTKIADSSRIFSEIESWYVGEKRVWK
jgi:ABC-type transport system substrate-binding protein